MVSCQGSLGTGDAAADGEADGAEGADGNVDGDARHDADAVTDTEAEIEIPPGCGDGVVSGEEECEPSLGVTQPCTTACGSAGTRSCTPVCAWGSCEPPDEVCNGADDDCNGEADDGFDCEAGTSELCYELCGDEVRRTCSPSCLWGACADPPGGCNEFVVPYGEDPYPDGATLVFSTGITRADVYFLVDTTGTMQEVVAALQGSAGTLILPVMAGEIPDILFGVGHFEDYPVSPYGGTGDSTYINLLNLSPDRAAAAAAIASLVIGYGGDYPESHVVALYTTATGDPGRTQPLQPVPSCGAGFFGYPCFRQDSFPLIVLISDANFHNGPAGAYAYTTVTGPTYDETVSALTAAHIKVMSIHSGVTTTDVHYRQLAVDTGTVDSDGNPIVGNIPGDGTGLADAVTAGFHALVNNLLMSVTARGVDDPADGVDATAFITRIVPNSVDSIEDPLHPGVFCVTGLAVSDIDGDSFDDTFTDLLAGTTVCFDIAPARNSTVSAPGTYRAFIEVLGDGIAVLDRREVNFIVP